MKDTPLRWLSPEPPKRTARRRYNWSPEKRPDDLPGIYGTWLDSMQEGGAYPWHYWTTYTFQLEPTARAIRRHVTRHLDRIGVARAFWGMEAGKVNGRLHAHALLHFREGMSGDPEDRVGVPPKERIWHDWHRLHGRAHVAVYESGKGAAHYVAKYVTKQLADYDMHIRGRK